MSYNNGTLNVEHVLLKRASGSTQGKPTMPNATNLESGELAVNYLDGMETIAVKNSNGSIAAFSSDQVFIGNEIGEGFANGGVYSANTVQEVIDSVSGGVSSHTSDATIHVTSSDKTNWNGKLNASEYNNYTSSTAPNTYATFDYVDGLFSANLDDSDVFVQSKVHGGSDTTFYSGTVSYGTRTKLNKVLSHFKVGLFDGNGHLTQELKPCRLTENISGDSVAIDGTQGDVLLYIDTNIYSDKSTVEKNSQRHDVLGLGLIPHTIANVSSKKFEPFAFTPHACCYSNSIPKSVYNTSIHGGRVQTSINSLTSSVNAINKGGGYMGLYYEFIELWLAAMYLEMGTIDITNTDYGFGNGCTNYTPTVSNWFSDTKEGGGGCMYSGNTFGSFWSNTVSSYDFSEMMEGQRIIDGVVAANLQDQIGGTVLMTYENGSVVKCNGSGYDLTSWDGSSGMTQDKKYFTLKNIHNCQGIADGVMSAIVNVYVRGTDRIRKYSYVVYRGLSLFAGFFTHLCGLHYVVRQTSATVSGNAPYQELYYASSWRDVPSSTTAYQNSNNITYTSGSTDEQVSATTPSMVGTYLKGGEFSTMGDGWASETDYNVSLFAHKAIGASQHTHECGRIWWRGTSYSSALGTNSNGQLTRIGKSVNASVFGCYANYASAGRTLAANVSVANDLAAYAGGFAHPSIVL